MTDLLKELRAELNDGSLVALETVVTVAAREFKREKREIYSKDVRRSSAEDSLIRGVVFAVAYDLCGLTYEELARVFGRHYSTIQKGAGKALLVVPEVFKGLRALVIEEEKRWEREARETMERGEG